jgi:hypothetical protein
MGGSQTVLFGVAVQVRRRLAEVST